MIKLNIKISAKLIITIIYLIIIISGITLLIISSMFLYNNFYLAITQSDDIVLLNQKTAIKQIDMEKFDEVIKKIDEKNSTSTEDEINNIFD